MKTQRVADLFGWKSLCIFLLAVVFVGPVLPATAQSPASPALRVNTTHDAHQLLDSMTMTPDGGISVLWDYEAISSQESSPGRVLLRRYSASGAATDPFVVFRFKDNCCFGGQLTSNQAGNLVAVISQPLYGGFAARRYGFSQGPTAFWIAAPKTSQEVPESVALDPAGGFVAVWRSSGQEKPDQADGHLGVFGRRFDPTGRPVGSELHVNTFRRGDQGYSSLALARETGAFVVVWQSKDQDGSGWGIYGQRFAADGTKLGGEFLVPTATAGDQTGAAVAIDSKGNFVVAWTGPDPVIPYRSAIFAQRFAANGERLGGEFQVSDATDGFESFAQIAVDPRGDFVISWDHWPIGLAYARLYRAGGTPVRPPIQITFIPGQLAPQLGFADNGTFGAAWTDAVPVADQLEDVYVQRFSASPGEEFCLFRRGELICDTGRTGGDPEVRYPFGGEPGEIGLLGDVDGDGRADLCLFRKDVFLCDTGHDFGVSETRIRFGQAGDIPLLGDVDGDGRADPCVYRSGRFLCDTAHDGGATEVTITFGQPGDVPLLGDINGDGKADPCVFRGGMFLCDTAHDGTVGVSIAFGRPGDVPLLGDFDGDGRADPCVYRAGQLLCNTSHADGSVGAKLTFGGGDGTPLLGNLDGL
jgi:hypothetical protein